MDEAANICAPYGVPFGTYYDLVDDNGSPVDLSTNKAVADIRQGSPDSPGTVALAVNTTNGKLVISVPPGGSVASRITMALSQADLTSPGGLAAADYWYALVLLDASSKRIQNGLVAVGAFQVTTTGLT